jgi:hypothetical protein
MTGEHIGFFHVFRVVTIIEISRGPHRDRSRILDLLENQQLGYSDDENLFTSNRAVGYFTEPPFRFADG